MKKANLGKKKSTWGRTWAIIFVILCTVTVLIFIWIFQSIDAKVKMSWVNEYVTKEAVAKRNELSDINVQLKAKIDSSAKIVTPETTKQLVRYYIHKYFPQNQWTIAEAVSTCEANMNPMTINDKNTNGSVDRGAWQINSVHAQRFAAMYGIDWKVGAHDIELSTKYAKFLVDHSGWQPWVCYRIINERIASR